MPKAVDYIYRQLQELGLEPQNCGHGITATIGQGGKCILLRADMDALPMTEESGEPFACTGKRVAHTCGHDLHAAMLLTAAKLLAEQSASLKGTVKLMFQPGEEILQGAADMIDCGVLQHPTVDAALGLHVAAGRLPMGLYMYNAKSAMMYSANNFSINIQGRGGHAAYPKNALNPIPAITRICTQLDEITRDCAESAFLSIGQIHSGTAVNIIPETAMAEGTLRTGDPGQRQQLLEKIPALIQKIAAEHGVSASFSLLACTPPLLCDPAMTEEMASYIQALQVPQAQAQSGITATASEDFAQIAAAVPSAFFYLSAGFMDARGDYPAHHPKVQFNEDVLPIGAACYAQCAYAWLQNHSCKEMHRVSR